MFTFAAKPRHIRLRQGAKLVLPNDVMLSARLGPAWLFGAGGDEPRFVVAGSTGVSMYFNGNTGDWHFKGGSQPTPLNLEVPLDADGVLTLTGRLATLTFRPTSLDELNGAAEAMLFGLPMLLNVRLPYACVVESVIGRTSDGEFGYEIERLEFAIPLIDQARFEADTLAALGNLTSVGQSVSARLQGALAYFYRAARLLEAGHTAWEFAAEAVLNLSKCLEALFPASGDQRTRDAVRKGLVENGISSDDAETWFLPSMALRSSLDVAHVKLAVLERAHVETLAEYTHGAFPRFRELLKGILDATMSGSAAVADYVPGPLDGSALSAIESLARRLASRRPPQAAWPEA